MLAALVALSCAGVLTDANTQLLREARAVLWTATSPLHFVGPRLRSVVAAPLDLVRERAALRREITALNQEVLRLRGALLRHDAVLSENARLRELSESRQSAREDTLVAELVMVTANPRAITLDKGQLHDVRLGQAVIDSAGLLGQVVETSALTSRVLLITDASHSVPVQVLRNAARAIAVGDGRQGLFLKDVPTSLDIREGDRLVTSGLGGRFPIGYPVGEVVTVVSDPTDLFAIITAKPSGALDLARQMLVVQELRDNGAGPVLGPPPEEPG